MPKTFARMASLSGCVLGAWLVFAIPVQSQESTGIKAEPALSPDQRIDAIFSPWTKPGSPGAAVAIINHGKIVFEKGYGSSNLEDAVPIKPETIFHVASVSKEFTAMAIVLLEQDGKLSLDDDVHKYLSELPDYGEKLTLRNLLQHTSGIRDQWQLLGLAGWDLRDVITQDQILRMLFRQKELNFKPGARFLYSNGGFTLLAEVVKRVSGNDLPEFCLERIFQPLEMKRTHFHLDLTEVVPNRAISYEPKSPGFALDPLNYANVGATSLYATAGDLVRWLDNFREPKIGGATALARMQEEGVLLDGKKTGYALGLAIGKYRGLRMIGHDGGDAGYRANVTWFPDQQLGIAVASNLGSFNANQIAKKVSDILLADYFTEPSKPAEAPVSHKAVKIEPGLFDKYAGTYEFDDRAGFTQTFTREGDRYFLQAVNQLRFEIFPESETHFFVGDFEAQITFVPGSDGKVDRFIQRQGGRDHLAHRYNPEVINEADLVLYSGSYWSEELETQYTFFVKDGKLWGRNIHHGEFPLTPGKKDKFSSQNWFTSEVTFTRDPAGNINGATLGGGRVLGVRFVRKPASSEKP